MDHARQVVEHGHDASAVIDDEGRCLFASVQLRRLLAWEEDRQAGDVVLTDLVHPDDAETARDLARRLDDGQPGRLATLRLRRSDGAYQTMEVAARRTASGGASVVVLNLRTGDASRSLNSALLHEQRLTAELERVLMPHRRFVATISHQLRTPASIVLAGSQTLAARVGELSHVSTVQLARAVHDHAQRLWERVESFDFASELREALIRREEVDAEELVAGVVAEHYAPSGPVRVDVSAGAVMAVDPTMVREALRAMLSNVVAHTPPGTHVAVSVRTVEGGIELAVEDDGPGIPRDLRSRVFEPFVTYDVPPFRPTVGLGLHLVDRVARAHGGSAYVEEGRSGGTRIVVRLLDGECPRPAGS